MSKYLGYESIVTNTRLGRKWVPVEEYLMSGRVQELLEKYHRQHPSAPLTPAEEVEVAGKQGVRPEHPAIEDSGASIDVDHLLNRERDRLAPAQLLPIGTYTLASGTALRIPLPREMRQIIIQNNSDVAGANPANFTLNVTMDGTPAGPGDYLIRPGSERAWDVYSTELWLYQASGSNVQVNNGGTAGAIVVLVAV
jgi:hypothetical protein